MKRVSKEYYKQALELAQTRWDVANDSELGQVSDRVIGNRYGYSTNVVRHLRQRLGITSAITSSGRLKHKQEIYEAAMRDLKSCEYYTKEVAAKYNIHISTIQSWCARSKITYKRKVYPLPPELKAKMVVRAKELRIAGVALRNMPPIMKKEFNWDVGRNALGVWTEDVKHLCSQKVRTGYTIGRKSGEKIRGSAEPEFDLSAWMRSNELGKHIGDL